MGCSQSNTAYSALSGTESDYKEAFDEVKTLGEGQVRASTVAEESVTY
jgi:hypothetical protein